MPKKKKLPPTRNPMMAHAKRRIVTPIDGIKKAAARDVWDRKAKHKDNEMTKKLDERVLGMTGLDSIQRMQELAGMKPVRQIKELDELGDDFTDIPMYSDEEFDHPDAEAPVDALPAPTGEFNDMGVDDMDMGPEDLSAPVAAVAGPVSSIDSSAAFIEISAKISEIETAISDIKVSEYKEVTNQLRALYQSVRDSGFSYLQESRNYKR